MTEYIEVTMSQSIVIPKDQWEAMEDDERAGWLEHNVNDQSAVAGVWSNRPAQLHDYAHFIGGKEHVCINCKDWLDKSDAEGLVLSATGDATCAKCNKE